MSTTTDAPGRIARLVRAAAILSGLSAGSVGLSASALAVTGEAQAVTAVFARPPAAIRLPGSVSIEAWNGPVARLVGRQPGYVGDLYASGALIVLPVRRSTCLAFRPA